jgi:hypothetical protein
MVRIGFAFGARHQLISGAEGYSTGRGKCLLAENGPLLVERSDDSLHQVETALNELVGIE